MENPIKMDDLGVPLFLETFTSCSPLIASIDLEEFFYTSILEQFQKHLGVNCPSEGGGGLYTTHL